MRAFPTLRTLSSDIGPAERLLWEYEIADGWDRYWRRQQFARIPDAFALPVARHYRALWEQAGEQKANLYLLELCERLAGLAIAPGASDDDLVALAKRVADICRRALQVASNHRQVALHLLALCRRYGIRPPYGLEQAAEIQPRAPLPALVKPASEGATLALRSVAATQPLRDVRPTSHQQLPLATIARLTDDAWWRRKLRVIHGRLLEGEAIRLHQVHRYAGLYVSDATFSRHQQQRRRNQRVLASLSAVNQETGEELSLDELATHSLANPANRRAELMVRIYGFDQLAIQLGHDALLLTVTCPSRMHAHLGKRGEANPKFDPDSTPRIAQTYLTKLWSRIRAKWQRQGIRPYGFRITEAHHDGTPHWHLLVFIEPADRQIMLDTVRAYALADTPDEPGAAKHRFQVEMINRAKGSATGYVAKYISKNIDGHGLEASECNTSSPGTAARRVGAWSSTWGVRQFQQVGGPPVSLWRELRRSPQIAAPGSLVGDLADAANRGEWSRFVTLLGGPQVSRKALPISLAKRYDSRLGRYGEPMGLRITGIQHGNVVFSTRLATWTIQRKAKTQNCTPSWSECPTSCPPEPSASFDAAAQPPWSSVNNCTRAALPKCNASVPHWQRPD